MPQYRELAHGEAWNPLLKLPFFYKTVIRSLVEDNMVQKGNTQHLSGSLELMSDRQIISAGRQIPGRMIMGHDYSRGAIGDGVGKYLARVYQRTIYQSHGDQQEAL